MLKTLACAIVLGGAAVPVMAQHPPSHPRLGQCFSTQVKWTGSRLAGLPDTGSEIEYADGHFQVSYEIVPGIQHSRHGDPVKLCVVQLPHNCPKNFYRGIVYRAVNQRTGEHWIEADTSHDCRGA